MDRLAEIVKNEVFWYAGGGPNIKMFPLANDDKRVYAVAVVDNPQHALPAEIIVMARLEGEYVIIEADNTNRPLLESLMAAGVPREKIILAYGGEALPDAV